jgi:hypothetical protein
MKNRAENSPFSATKATTGDNKITASKEHRHSDRDSSFTSDETTGGE